MTYDYLIIGGGITGIGMARLLQLSGVERILILEAENTPGGLCRTREVGPHVLDVGGGHFLCTRHPEVYQFIFSHLPKTAFNHFARISHVETDGAIIDYPVESNLWQLPDDLCADYLVSVAQNGEARGQPPPNNFEAWIRWKLGDRIAEGYMLPYNRKIWGVPASEMDLDWLHKIPRVDVREIARSCVRRKADTAKMPSHASFYYPKQGGFQRIFDALLQPVSQMLQSGVPVERIEKVGDTLVVNGRYRARQIINTAPWHALAASPIFDDAGRTAINRLRNNEIVVSLHEENYTTKAHWLYEPAETKLHHRSFFIHNFAPHSARSGVYRETNMQRWSDRTPNLFHELNRYAYPIPTLGWADAISLVLKQARHSGVQGLGRWGQWQYFNSDVCLFEAMNLADTLGHHRWRDHIAHAPSS